MTTEEPPLTASTTSILDKPLHQLTEDDISQLTREDCRRYLKRKGMRRPSWNKSQAIQQVIMLKALLEPTPDSDGCCRKLRITHLQQETPTTRAQKGTSAVSEVSVSADESVRGQIHDMDHNQSDVHGDNDFVRHGYVSPYIQCSLQLQLTLSYVRYEGEGQMTIFYSGKVDVYDDVLPERHKHYSSLLQAHYNFPKKLHLMEI